MAGNRRLTVLVGVLAVTIALTIWLRFGGTSGPAPANQAAPAAARQTRPATGAGSGPVDVHLEALAAERPAPDEGGRNPFEFGVARASADESRIAEATPQPAVESFVPAGPPPAPPIGLKFIGLVEKGDTKMAILSGAGYTVIGQEGEAIDGRYRILKIGVESLEIAYLDGSGRQTIRLTGQ